MKSKVLSSICMISALFANSLMAKETITVSGSTSVTDIMEVLSEKYQSKNPNVFIEIQGTGSSAGIKASQNGSSMLGMVSRSLTNEEKSPELKETIIALDGIAIVVNNKNSVDNLTIANIDKIYRGEIKSWADVGGAKKPLVVVTRDTASGTRSAFEEIMGLKKKVKNMTVSAISQRAQVANGNGVVKTIVSQNPYAIGFISLGSVDSSLKAIKVEGSAPSIANVASGQYKVARPFLLLSKDATMTPAATQFLNWIISKEGQEIVKDHGYVPAN
ncbi:MAG: phosphate ABC transporter substrate-binding protein [Enterovibrio sp.]